MVWVVRSSIESLACNLRGDPSILVNEGAPSRDKVIATSFRDWIGQRMREEIIRVRNIVSLNIDDTERVQGKRDNVCIYR